MPEDTAEFAAMTKKTLDELENYTSDDRVSRYANYKIMQNAVENDMIDTDTLQRLLDVCIHDSSTWKYTTTVINILSVIASKVKIGKYDPVPDLMQSATAIINILKTIVPLNKVDSVMALSFHALISFPVNTLIAITNQYENLIEMFNAYCNLRVPKQAREQALSFLYQLLKILPPEPKREFVEKGVSFWFAKVIPTVMVHLSALDDESEMNMETLEMLTDDLLDVDYTDNPQWRSLLECLCNAKQYPAVMKSHLFENFDAWHRLWMVFVRLLKHQVTLSLGSIGSPINSLLPVVEAAFKLDTPRRLKAFECWIVLIDSFSMETNQTHVLKRLKLLLIPLKANNVRTEELALAKFRCWWHLLWKFEGKMDTSLDSILVSILQFCFGKFSSIDKSNILVPGQMSVEMKKNCNQALVDMCGHVNCDGCTDLPRLKNKIITTKNLVDNWNHWVYSLTTVIMKTTSNNGLTNQQLTCLWKSFLKTIGELPENNIRKDLFNEVLSIATHLVQSSTKIQFLEIAFNVIVMSLFDENTKIKHLFKSDKDPNDPIFRVVKIIVDSPLLYEVYKSIPTSELTMKMKAFTNLIFTEGICTSRHISKFILPALPINDVALMFWNALAESMCETKSDNCLCAAYKILLWPQKFIHKFKEVKIPAMTWYIMYNTMYPKLNKTDIDHNEIPKFLISTSNDTNSTVYFKLCVVLGVLKHKISEGKFMECEKEINLLSNLTKSIDNYEYFESILEILIDGIVTILITVSTNVNENVAALILVCVKNVLHVLSQQCLQQSDVSHQIMLIGVLVKPLEEVLAVDSYVKLIPAMTNHLLQCFSLLADHPKTQIIIHSVMKTILSKLNTSDTCYPEVLSVIKNIENIKSEITEQNYENITFTSPQTIEISKKTKNKGANIVNTVVDNGEEYVVVKSNWKFNPKKLTENQKEKLQRKREDIPALYQDLSQSQDEFKLMSWRTDSQDTTSSSRSASKSTKPGNTETATEILKNLPSTNVVPKILENFFSDKEKNDSGIKDTLSKDNNIAKTEAVTPSPKNTKSPRMALKDRVFRNVRNLIENSGLQKENKDLSEVPNKITNNDKTPTHTKETNSVNIDDQAPLLLSADRPSRVKRKPKKFEDLDLLTSKRSRHLLQTSNSDSTEHHDKSSTSKNDSNINGKNIAANQNIELLKSDNLQACVDIETLMDISHINENVQPSNCNNDYEINKEKTTNIREEQITNTSDILDDKIDEGNEVPLASKPIRNCIQKDSSNDVENIQAVSALKSLIDINKVMTDKTSKDVTESVLSTFKRTSKDATSPMTFKQLTEKEDFKEVSIPLPSIDIVKMSTQKISKSSKEVSTSSMSEDGTEVLTPKISLCIKEVPILILSNDVTEGSTLKTCKRFKEISTPSTYNVKEVTTPKSSQAGKEMSTLNMSKDVLEISTTKFINNEVSTPSVSKDDKKVSTSKTSRPIKEVSAPIMTKDDKEVSTPKTSRSVKEVSAPSMSKDDKELSIPKTSRSGKEVSAPTMSKDDKEVLTPKTSKADKEVSAPSMSKDDKKGSTPNSSRPVKEVLAACMSKDDKEVLTLKTSRPVKEVSAASMSQDDKELSTPKTSTPVKEVTAPSVSKDEIGESSSTKSVPVKEVSSPSMSEDTKKVSTPKTYRRNKNTVVTTPKAKLVKEVSFLGMFKDNKEVLTPKIPEPDQEVWIPVICQGLNKEVSPPKTYRRVKKVSTLSISKDDKEVSTPKASRLVKEVSTLGMSKDDKKVSTPKISKPVKEVSTPSVSNDDKEVSNDHLSIDVNKVLSPNVSKDSKEVASLKQSKDNKYCSTPKLLPKGDEQKSTAKKSTVRKSRIEKELAIDMVEGHPYLKIHTAKRLTRKTLESANTGRRKSLAAKLYKSKSEAPTNSIKKSKEKNKESENTSSTSIVVDESQESQSEKKEQASFSEELPYSDDVIESSQDSTITTISTKSTMKMKVPVVRVFKLDSPNNQVGDINISQSILDRGRVDVHRSSSPNNYTKDDSVLPLNKTMLEEKTQDDLTENMDTEPMDEKDVSDDIILLNHDIPAVTIATEDSVGPETQEIAEADTQPTDPKLFMDIDETQENIPGTSDLAAKNVNCVPVINIETAEQDVTKAHSITPRQNLKNLKVLLYNLSCTEIEQSSGASSPFKDEAQRQKDFLNNTIEISPIKTMSPDRNKKSPSPETSSDYVVITLSSPVHSNGEPFDKCGSPEVFTEDKVSPDKRDQSPPRVEIIATNNSPSSSLSLKKNRPQVRSGGRAAQMLGLCVPDKVQAIVNPERNESEEVKKGNSTNTPARRNLRILYNSVGDNIESSNCTSENDDCENFLKFRRTLPAVDSSPSVPILKRKLAEITDDAMISPASKRKRVSFHDPVSTTISVQKYIEPGVLKSPQNSAQKRLERQLRQQTPLKSPKRLENVFKLDTVLTKTVESFSDSDIVPISYDTQQISLDATPVVEIIRISELNDTDPICPDLLDCEDPIENIAAELSSPAMKSLLIKELEGKIETVGDLAKMTEVQVNRLCIKAPKVKVAKKVLEDYASMRGEKTRSVIDEAEFDEPMMESDAKGIDIEVQTETNVAIEKEVQTIATSTRIFSVQTDAVPSTHTGIQTDESGSKSTAEIIKSCLSEKPDFLEQLSEHLDETSIGQLSNKLPLSTVTDLLTKKITPSDTKTVLVSLLERSSSNDKSKELSFLNDYLCNRFESKDLILLCSQILKLVYDKRM